MRIAAYSTSTTSTSYPNLPHCRESGKLIAFLFMLQHWSSNQWFPNCVSNNRRNREKKRHDNALISCFPWNACKSAKSFHSICGVNESECCFKHRLTANGIHHKAKLEIFSARSFSFVVVSSLRLEPFIDEPDHWLVSIWKTSLSFLMSLYI